MRQADYLAALTDTFTCSIILCGTPIRWGCLLALGYASLVFVAHLLVVQEAVRPVRVIRVLNALNSACVAARTAVRHRHRHRRRLHHPAVAPHNVRPTLPVKSVKRNASLNMSEMQKSAASLILSGVIMAIGSA